MIRPIIGITTSRILGEGSRERVQYVSYGTGRAYVTEVARAGGLAVMLPPLADRGVTRAAVEALDGLLLTGGGDIAPSEFGDEPHPATKLIDPDRDRMEIEATRLALRRGVPVLGICRGIQLINVALGGGLIQDIPSQVKEDRPTYVGGYKNRPSYEGGYKEGRPTYVGGYKGDVRHWSKDLTPVLSHTIEIEKGSLLARLIGAGRVLVNSSHHQAAGRVGRGLRVTAAARDGVIEALESEDGAPVLAVQFHPEDVAGEHERFRAIFEWLVNEARRYRRKK